MDSSAVNQAFSGDQLIDYTQYITNLVALKLPLLIYAGEWDARDGPKTLEKWMRRLYWNDN
jgi:hypothetical protein